MSGIKYLKGDCSLCGGHIEFPADAIGMSTDCPHCGKSTELALSAPPDQPALSRRTIVWTIIAVLVLALGLGGALYALNLAKTRVAARHQLPPAPVAATTNAPPSEPEDPVSKAGFRISPIALEKDKPSGNSVASSLVYAVGTLTNPSDKQRFGVRIELEVFDASDKKIGTATDYAQVIEPKGEWRFKALVPAKANSAKLSAIKEDK
jgi:hypothetical protein